MTDQPTNPLVAGKGQTGRKATVADLEFAASEMNAQAVEYGCPWRYAVVPNDRGKMCLRKVDYSPPPRLEPKRDVMDRRGERMTAAETDELNRRLEYLGATARYRPDGTRYTIQAQAA